MRNLSAFVVIVIAVFAVGCGSDTGAADAGEQDSDASASGDAGDDGGGGQEGDACERASDCEGELVCDPSDDTCADGLSCEEHDDCGLGAHCAEEGTCAESEESSPCGDDDDCAASDECNGGFCACQGQTFEADVRDVNMHIVLDRSGSMARDVNNNTIDGGAENPDSKWKIALGAIELLLQQFGDQASFGLQVFPHSESVGCSSCPDVGGAGCREGNILVDVGPDNAGDIGTALDGTGPGCCTPTGNTLDEVVGYGQLADPDTDNFVLLVADGAENCEGDAVAAAETLRNQDPPVRTFVVGFGGLVDPGELDDIAEAGGTARDGEPKYYEAGDAEALEEAFRAIAGEALACSYELDSVPTEPDDLEVYFDGEPVERDPSREDGWDYDAEENEILFFGPACDALSAGSVGDLTINQPCDVIVD